MTTTAIAICWILVALTALQTIFGLGFYRVLRRLRYPPLNDQQCPQAAVILCLRGADPFLADTLAAILDLDYPRYGVRIIIDSQDDPAGPLVAEVLSRQAATNVRVEVLKTRHDTCGLKCSSLLQVIAGLDASDEVIALLDADTVPHRQWLRELVAPLADPAVGVAAGNRWYMPEQPTWGDLVRYLWNASAVAQMYWSKFSWGGSLALKTHVLRETDLLQRWSRAFCEDTTIYASLRKHGLRVAFVPTLMMVNRESCTLRDFFPWMRRQLLNGRLYHPAWPVIATHGAIATAALAAAVIVLAAGVLTANWQAAAWVAGGLLVLQISNAVLLGMSEHAVRQIVGARGEAVAWLRAGTVARLALAMPLTQLIYAAALLSLVWMREVQWRGVSYRIAGPWDVQLIRYHPYRSSQLTKQTTSL